MSRIRLLCAACGLLAMSMPALAQDSCKPVETAPGIKSVPAGCNKVRHDVTGTVAKPALPSQKPGAPVPKAPPPAPKPSALFPGEAPGSIMKFGDTEVRINGRVRYEYQYSR